MIITQYLKTRPLKEYINFNYAIQDVNESIQRFGIEIEKCSEISRDNKKRLIDLGMRRVELRLPVKNIITNTIIPDYHVVLFAIIKPQELLGHSTWMISFNIETGDQKFFEPKIL